MARKKKSEPEITPDSVNSEQVTGTVEGLTYSRAELEIQERARLQWMAKIDWNGFGQNQLSEYVGMVFYNRTRNRGARETSFSCGPELAGAIDAYWCLLMELAEHKHTNIPDVESLADFLGVSRETLLRWRRGEANLEFVDPLNVAFNEIAQVKKQLAYNGRINGLMYLSDMQNNHGYIANQKITDMQVNVRLKNELPSREQLTAKAELLP